MYRVLIVDDEPIICKGLRDTIEWDSLGLEISGEAHNGVDALDMIKIIRPHIMITDIRMPAMDGIKLIKAIRELDLHIRIIILSGFSDYAFLKEAIRLGVDSYLLKPIDNDELISNLADLVNTIEKEMLRTTQLYHGIEILRSNTLNRLVTNKIGRSEFEEKAAFLDVTLTAERYLCVVCIAENEDSGLYGYGEPNLALAIQNICSALLKGEGFAFVDSKNRVTLLLFGGAEEKMLAAANGVLVNVGKQVLEYYGKPVITCMGCVVCTIEEIWKSYASATERFDHEKKVPEDDRPDGSLNNSVERTLAYVAAHYHEALSLKQVANFCDINTSYLGQIFKKATGESFANFVNKYRIEKAKHLLSNSNLKVYEVAQRVGFTDYRYFLKIYKKITGINPTETRN
jgi:two-component system, response regulator YesN